MGQLADLDNIANVNQTAPHDVLELALLHGWSLMSLTSRPADLARASSKLLLPSQVALHAHDVQGTAFWMTTRARQGVHVAGLPAAPPFPSSGALAAQVKEVVGIPTARRPMPPPIYIPGKLPDAGFHPAPDQEPSAVHEALQEPELVPHLQSCAHHPHRRLRIVAAAGVGGGLVRAIRP